jgi:uncharacterized protein (DUF885 family)
MTPNFPAGQFQFEAMCSLLAGVAARHRLAPPPDFVLPRAIRKSPISVSLAAIGLWLAVCGCGFAQNSNASHETQRCEPMADFIRNYQTEQRNVSEFYDLPWSETRFDRMDRFYHEWQQRLQAVDFEGLDESGRIDYLLLRNKLRFEVSRLKLSRRRLAEMTDLLPFRTVLLNLEQTRWQMKPVDAPAAASTVAALPEQIRKLRERIEAGRKSKDKKTKATDAGSGGAGTNAPSAPGEEKPKAGETAPIEVTPLLAKRASEATAEIRGTFKRWFSSYDGFQPEFSWWVKKPYDEATKSLEEYEKFLREDIAGLKGKDEDPLLGEALGAEALAEDLANESIAYSPQEVIAIGERELAWCETEMKKVAAQMGFGDDWRAALAKIKGDFAPPGSQDALVADLAHEAIGYVRAHDLVTIPDLCDETWRLAMLSPEGQKNLPFAAYGGQHIQVAYAKDEMKNEDKIMAMRGNNRHFTRIVVAHELIPGHHLQSFMSQRNHAYRALFSTPFLVEGWALYWEFKLWDLGYGQTPEDKLGMLFWRRHRAARIIVSLKFHLGQMKPAEMVDFLVDQVGHERFGATSEVRRFIGGAYSPLYQCGYYIGGLQLTALHHEAVDSGRMKEKQFNDTVLTYGPIPVDFIRAGMLDPPLTAKYVPNWKFAR